MDLETLRIFAAVATELNVTRTASRLGRAPSNVTTRIQQLESELGVELFIRVGRRITLSAAGERFLTYARRMLALEEEARHVVGGDGDGGCLRIGSMESTAASRLPVPLAAYNRAYPQTRLEVSTGPSAPLVEQVRNGQLDCAFVVLPAMFGDDASLAEAGLQGTPVWSEELRLLLPAADAEARTPAEVRTRSLAAFRPGCMYRAMAEEWLDITVGSGWTIQELGSYHAMIAAVSAGACVTLLPRSVLNLGPVPEGLATLRLGAVGTHLIWRSNYALPAFQAFMQLLRGEEA